ncbi:HNH endonuclease [Streptomyces sp. NPDC060187]|uniref:HNH endonuclease n=1 Tax=Streptomyces sp. NPDC060187 TaxID=3347067 RepID=UPI00365D8EA8
MSNERDLYRTRVRVDREVALRFELWSSKSQLRIAEMKHQEAEQDHYTHWVKDGFVPEPRTVGPDLSAAEARLQAARQRYQEAVAALTAWENTAESDESSGGHNDPNTILTAVPTTATANAQRRCSVCGRTGVAEGASRHRRCESSSRPSEASPSSAAARPPTPAGVDESPDAQAVTQYRRLVKSIERQEEATQGRRTAQTSNRPVRLIDARKAVLLRCQGRCENPTCGGQPTDVTASGQPILEVDHVVEIAAGGRDHPVQMVALCPNCHAMKGRGRNREALRSVLVSVANRAHADWNLSTRSKDA